MSARESHAYLRELTQAHLTRAQAGLASIQQAYAPFVREVYRMTRSSLCTVEPGTAPYYVVEHDIGETITDTSVSKHTWEVVAEYADRTTAINHGKTLEGRGETARVRKIARLTVSP